MSDVFPKWTNRLPLMLCIGVLLVGTGIVIGVSYYFTPKYTRVGYRPFQPTGFSHKVHVGQVGMDCRYCHSSVEKSWFSNLPATSTCMNCHDQILKEDPRLAVVRESAKSGKPIPWVQVHKLPDFVHFNHAVHVNRGVGCVECHGRVDKMDEISVAQPLSMAFCLDCHRDPGSRLRPLDKITQLDWMPTNRPGVRPSPGAATSPERVEKISPQRQFPIAAPGDGRTPVKSLEQCSTCHQ